MVGLKADLPDSWTSADIGTVGAAGSALFDAETGVYTLQGSGLGDIAGTADHFHFAYRSLDGDGQIVARIASLANTNAWAKAGVMIRETLDSNSKHALMMITPSSGAGIKWRSATGGGSTQVIVDGAAPRWLKLERRGNMITGSESSDGIAWNVVQRVALMMGSDVKIGLFACSRSSGLTTMTADQVLVDAPEETITLPWPWLEHTVGSPLDPGVAIHDGSFVLSNLGADITGTADKMKYVSRTLTGDGTLTVKVASVASADNSTRFGLMMRDSLDANARNVLLGLSTSKSVVFMSRRTIGGATASRAASVTVGVPSWLRLQRTGNVFTAWRSSDGINWTEHGSETLDLGPTLHVGLAYSNRSLSTWAIGVGDDLKLLSPADLDGNGLPDAWETRYFGQTGIDLYADPDQDGLANNQEWELGNNPLVPNQEGQRSVVELVGGNGQTALAGALLPQALVIRVKNSLTNAPLAGVPVQLQVVRGEGRLGSGLPGASSLSRYSDANGLVQSPFLLPETAGLNVVTATVGGGTQAVAVTFNLKAVVGEAPVLFELDDLGAPALGARAVYEDGNYTLSGATVLDNSGTSDNSAFVWRELDGDGYILARAHFVDATSSLAQVGVMIRESLDANSPNVAMLLTPGNGVAFQWRDTAGGNTGVSRKTGVAGPVWLLLRRSGDVLTGFYSTDGTTWIYRATRTLALNASVKVGLTLGTRTTVHNSAVFDALRVGPLANAPWQVVDIGQPRASALDDFTADSVFVRAGGSDITGNADTFHYVYQALPGDGRLITRVASQLATHSSAKSALMIRENLEPGSRHVTLMLTASGGITLRSRAQTAGTTATLGTLPAVAAPYWLRVDRLGNRINAYASPEGENWTLVGTTLFDAGSAPLIGLAASSNNVVAHTETLFEHLDLTTGEGRLGWNAAYFEGANFDLHRLFRRDIDLDFTWPVSKPPVAGIPAGAYSVRWQGDLVPAHSETYTFTTLSQGAVRVVINGQTIIDRWTSHTLGEATGTITLTAGQPVRVIVEYSNSGEADGRLQLRWASASQPDQSVPFTAVRALDADDDGLFDTWENTHGLDPNNPADATLDSDADGLTNLLEYQLGGDPFAADDRLPGVVTMETWTGIGGYVVRDFTKTAKFHGASNTKRALTSLDAEQNTGDNYGRRIRGYLVPPATGDYRFHLSANESAELWLSTDDSPFTRVKIARVGQGATAYSEFDARPEQHSVLLPLQAGQHYYFEILHKENGSADHLTVAWTRPGMTMPEVVTGAYLALFTGHPDDLDGNGLPDLWETAEGLAPSLADAARGSYGDADNDRLPNLLEFQHGLDPHVADTDLDGYEDFLEVVVEADPLHTSDLNLSPWQLGDVGPVSTLALANRVDPQSFLLAGTGTGMAMHKEDNFRFLHREVSGDFELTARIARPESNAIGLAGVSVRSGLDSHAVTLTLLQAVDGLNAPFVRPTEGGAIVPLPAFTPVFASEAASIAGYWFRVRREGNLVSLFYSADGQRWMLSNTRALALGEKCLVGFAICHNMGPFTSLPDIDIPVRLIKDVTLVTDLTPVASPETVPPDATVSPIATINGSAGVTVRGQWATNGTDLVSQVFTGTLDYTFTVPADGLYRLTFTALSTSNPTVSTLFPVEISVDGQFVARVNLVLPLNEEGLARIIAPWLKAGTHTVRLFYDNTLSYHPLTIRSLAVEQLGGADADADGRADWIDARLRALNTIDAGSGELYVSPASLDGLTRHRSLFQLTADGQPVVVNPAPGFGWYADVPLNETAPVELVGDFENSGSVQGVALVWSPLNLLGLPEDYAAARHLRVRKDDSLRLTVFDPQTNAGGTATLAITAPDATVTEHALTIPNPHAGQNNGNGHGNGNGSGNNTPANSLPIVCAFTQPGIYTITGVFTDKNHTVTPAAPFTVEVVEAVFASDPVVGLNNTPVTWDNPLIFDDVLLEVDQGLLLWKTDDLAGGGTRFSLASSNIAESYIVARLGEDGPIFGHATVRGLRAATISDTAMDVLQVYPDGSQLIGVPVIVSPLTENTRVEIEIFVQGVTFDDGTIAKVLTKDDFDEYGRVYLKFIYPKGVDGSICHRVHVYEGQTYLGSF